MASDELDKLGLDEEEVAFIRAQRKQKRESRERMVPIKTKDGHEATLPFEIAEKWLRKIGVVFDDEPAEPVEEPDPEPEEKTIRFAGRTIGKKTG